MTINNRNEFVLQKVQAIKKAASTPVNAASEPPSLLVAGVDPKGGSRLRSENIPASQPTLLTANQLCLAEPALTLGGVRHLLFTKGHDLPGVYRFGRKLLFDRAEFMTGIKEGHTAQISGRASK